MENAIGVRHCTGVAVLCAFTASCGGSSRLVKRPADLRIDLAITQMWAEEVRRVGQDGDWILTRSYSASGDVIAVATAGPIDKGGVPLSHASMLDRRSGSIIEAFRPTVRETSLETLIKRNHYLIVVRPNKLSVAEREASVARARSQVGTQFDVGGMFGIDDDEEWYCSELLYWASEIEKHGGRKHVIIEPAELLDYGTVVYFSGERTNPDVLSAGAARVADGDRLVKDFSSVGRTAPTK